jgi:hypothetical protein
MNRVSFDGHRIALQALGVGRLVLLVIVIFLGRLRFTTSDARLTLTLISDQLARFLGGYLSGHVLVAEVDYLITGDREIIFICLYRF